MREIKFRGKRVDNREWAYGYYGFAEGKPYMADWDKGFRYDFGDGTTGNKWHIPVIPETVGQFTGLHGKNGVEIWEGDKCRFGHRKTNRDVGVVIYEQDFCAFGCWNNRAKRPTFHFCTSDFEIIGNKWDKELLNG